MKLSPEQQTWLYHAENAVRFVSGQRQLPIVVQSAITPVVAGEIVFRLHNPLDALSGVDIRLIGFTVPDMLGVMHVVVDKEGEQPTTTLR